MDIFANMITQFLANSAFAEMFWEVMAYVLGTLLMVAASYGTFALRKGYEKLRSSLDDSTEAKIEEIIAAGIRIAEQFKANGWLPDIKEVGEEAKEKAMAYAQAEFNRRGIKLSVDDLSDKIEKGYYRAMNGDYAIFDRVDRIEFIGTIVELSLKAYIESESGEAVKDFVAEKTEKILKEYGVTVDLDVLETLILSKIKEMSDAVKAAA